jgi:hypothetical protein
VSEQTTIVCCIESGPLEQQTVLLAETLRRWGGPVGQSPMYAVTPRPGPRLLPSTHEALERSGVQHLRLSGRSKYVWQHYLNKPLSVLAVAERAGTELVTWFDSDMLVADQPDQIMLAAEVDFVACPRDRGGIGSSGPDDAIDGYWRRLCDIAGLEIDGMPWVTTEEEGARIRLYWNSGLFTFRRATSFAEDYLRLNVQLLDARLRSTTDPRVNYTDQIALGLSMLRCGLRWQSIGHDHNFGVSRWHPPDPDGLAKAKVVHYHDSLAPDFFPQLVAQLQASHPELADHLRATGPLVGSPLSRRLPAQVLRGIRSVRRRRYYRRCTWV